MNRLNTELQEVHKIMAQNIEDVLQRGDALQCNCFFKIFICLCLKIDSIMKSLALDNKAQNLRSLSDKYRGNAQKLNMQSTYAKIFAIIVLIIIGLFVVKYYMF